MSRMGISHSFTDRGDVKLSIRKAHSKSKILSPSYWDEDIVLFNTDVVWHGKTDTIYDKTFMG